MSKKTPKKRVRGNPSNNPQDVGDGESCWYYESRGGINVYVREPGHAIPVMRRIPWKMLMASAKRCRPEEVRRVR